MRGDYRKKNISLGPYGASKCLIRTTNWIWRKFFSWTFRNELIHSTGNAAIIKWFRPRVPPGGLGWKVTWHLNGQSRARRMSPTFEEILLIGGRRMKRPALDKRQKPLILGWWVDFELWTRLRKLAAVELLVSVRKLVSQFSLFWGEFKLPFNLICAQ